MIKTTDTEPTALYQLHNGLYVPSVSAGSPWSAGHQHGGPACGLLASLAESEVAQRADGFLPVRLSVDLFRPVPLVPLLGRATVVRAGRRLMIVDSWLEVEGAKSSAGGGPHNAVCRASTLFLRATTDSSPQLFDDALQEPTPTPPVATGQTSHTSMIPPERRAEFPPGFHFEVEVEWEDWRSLPGAWIRMPMPLLAGRSPTAFERVATLSDFANAVSGRLRFARARQPRTLGFINCDSHLALDRPVQGEWLYLACERFSSQAGIGQTQVVLFDRVGRCGTIWQSSLEQPRYERG